MIIDYRFMRDILQLRLLTISLTRFARRSLNRGYRDVVDLFAGNEGGAGKRYFRVTAAEQEEEATYSHAFAYHNIHQLPMHFHATGRRRGSRRMRPDGDKGTAICKRHGGRKKGSYCPVELSDDVNS